MSLETLPRTPVFEGSDVYIAIDALDMDEVAAPPTIPGVVTASGHHTPPSVPGAMDGAAKRPFVSRAAFRLFDIVIASIALVVFLPLFALLVLAMSFSSRGPIMFAHQRVGRFGKMFPCLKFRTMRVDADQVLAELLAASPAARAEWDRDFKLRDDPRITPIGGLLRKTSLDELPQLLNVLAGHMSIVGPRPIVPGEIERYGEFFADYCSVRPGLTGLWQVSGRNDVSYDERVQMDVFYARAKSVLFDMSIIARTVPAVVMARGSY